MPQAASFVAAGLSLGLLTLLAGCNNPDDRETKAKSPTQSCVIEPLEIDEASGLAPSLGIPDCWWVNNDSGGKPLLYLLDANGVGKGSVRILGATNYDWEDCASFRFKGKNWLLAADTGDNDAVRKSRVLYVIKEPDAGSLTDNKTLDAPLAWSLPFDFPEGPSDCEAVGVDATQKRVFLLTKRTQPPVLYSISLEPRTDGQPQTAQREAELEWLTPPDGLASVMPTPGGRLASQPTALSFSADGRRAILLTYRELWLVERTNAETWAQAFARKPLELPRHGLPQAEGAGITPNGRSARIVSEGRKMRVMSQDLP